MNELTKTLTFVGVSIAVLAVAVASRPHLASAPQDTLVGTMLNQVDDPLAATELQITEFLPEKSAVRQFEVAKRDGSWVIPSHDNYPADAEQQMADAATSVMNLEILGVASTNAGDHEVFGVLTPDPKQLSVGSVGVGTQVSMKDDKGDSLVSMIIGKEVKGQAGQRYVRNVGKDPVFVVMIDPSKLKTQFGDWIEKDLLKLSPADVIGLQLDDYSFNVAFGLAGPQIDYQPRAELKFAYDNDAKDDKWKVVELKEFDKKQNRFVEVQVPEDEKLNQTKLDDLKTALADLKIVDVEPKPAGLGADLRAGKQFSTNRDTVQSLVERGFVPLDDGKGGIEIRSSEGEVICAMKDGIEYILRFGKIVLGSSAPKTGDDGEEGEGETSGINRYLFVATRFNKDLVEQPVLEDVPAPSAKAKVEDTAKSTDEASQADPSAAKNQTDEDAAKVAEPKEDAEQKDAVDKDADAKQDGDKADLEEKERQKIIAENERKQKTYDDKIAAGEKHVEELNGRFADWYYVISDEVYKKIHLGRAELFEKEKPAKGEAEDDADLGGLNPLQKQGIQGLTGEKPTTGDAAKP